MLFMLTHYEIKEPESNQVVICLYLDRYAVYSSHLIPFLGYYCKYRDYDLIRLQ